MSNQAGGPPPHFVVLVPGYMGSKLRDRATGEIVWLDLAALVKNPLQIRASLERLFTKMAYPNPDLEPAGIMDQVVFAPPLFKQEHYGRLVEALESMGYQTDPAQPRPDTPAVYTFSYDWRQDNRISAQQLGNAIDGWRARHPGAQAWLIGHSNGGIVARWYIEKEGGKDYVGRLFLMGSPWDGAPKALQVMHKGFQVMFMRLFNLYDISRLSREVVLSFPSFYQLIPYKEPFLRDLNNYPVDLFGDLNWLEEEPYRQMLLDGRRFNQEMGNTLSVETLCFFGAKKITTTGGLLRVGAGGKWKDIEWDRTEAGDGTVPERSAVHPQAREKLPFSVGHGDIYVDPAVLEKLEWEMVRKYRLGVLAEAVTGRYRIMFEPDKDYYDPGESIHAWARVTEVKSGAPVFDAKITARLVWREALPNAPVMAPPVLPEVALVASSKEAGRYEAELVAPYTPGYYQLQAVVEVGNEAPLTLEEMVLIEAEPGSGGESGSRGDEGSRGVRLPGDAVTRGEGGETLRGGGLLRRIEPPSESGPVARTRGGVRRHFDRPPTLGAPPADETGAAPRELQPEAEVKREVAVEVRDQLTEQKVAKPLRLSEEYLFNLYVATEKTEHSVTLEASDEQLFQPGEEATELSVYLTSKEFTIHTPGPQNLRLARAAGSRNKARFDIQPLKEGKGEITAVLLKDNNYVQSLNVTLGVGEAEQSAILSMESVGRPLFWPRVNQPRDVFLFIKNMGASFDVHMVDSMVTQGNIPLNIVALEDLINELRQELLNIVYLYGSNGSYFPYTGPKDSIPASIDLFYQSGIEIPAEAHQESLRRLANAGYLLFNAIFSGSAQNVGDRLRNLASEKKLRIQIASQEFLLPWGSLYLSETPPGRRGKVDPDLFLGFKHIIEHIPLAQRKTAVDYEIPSKPLLTVSLNLNKDIDYQVGEPIVEQQLEYWKGVAESAGIQVIERYTDEDLFTALNDPELPDQIQYYYCHAVSETESKTAGLGGSLLSLSNDTQVSLRDLLLEAPEKTGLNQAPLVFINACQSARLSPAFYRGFMPYFTAKGARGVIGTECEVPARFAAEWARRFFDRFLTGSQSLGEVVLELRREFLEQENNLLGLLYAIYCDGDTRIVPGVQLR